MKFKKISSKLHLYLSLPVGLIISLICFTGAGMVLDKDIHKWANPNMYSVKPIKTGILTIDSLVHKVMQQLPEGTEVKSIKTFADPKLSYQLSVNGTLKSTVFVDQYTGKYLGDYNSFKKGSFYRTMFYLHRWLMVPSERGEFNIGKLTVGISTAILVFILITGVVIWLPRNKHILKRRLSIRLTKGWRKFFYDLHVSGGVYIAIWLLILALTGLMWSFPNSYRPAIYTLFGIDTKKVETKIPATSDIKVKADFTIWQSAYTEVISKNPNAYYYSISPAEVRVYHSQYGNTRAYESSYFNTETGVIEEITPYSERSGTSKFMGLIYSIHVGNWGGITSKILTFLISLFGGILPLTGYYLWFKRK